MPGEELRGNRIIIVGIWSSCTTFRHFITTRVQSIRGLDHTDKTESSQSVVWGIEAVFEED